MNTETSANLQLYVGDITFDVANPEVMAQFWAAALHYEIQEITPIWAAIVDPSGKGPRCCFQQVDTPKIGKNRLHLDLFTSDMETEVERLVALGAQKVRTAREDDVVWTVMLDPENNEFCVQPPQVTS